MTIAERMLALRLAAGLTQTAVAKKLGVTRTAYLGWEAGRREPSLTQLKNIARLYELSVGELVEGELSAEDDHSAIELEARSDVEPREIVRESPEKLREVLLYVLDKIGAKPNVGETVIYKLLYFIDFDYYEKFGKSITGLTYVRNTYGPTPTRTFAGVVETMKRADELEVIDTKYFNHTQKKYLPAVRPVLDRLSAQELRHIDEELARLGDKSAGELSDLSHKDTPWLVAKDREPIDYRMAMYRGALTSVREDEDEL